MANTKISALSSASTPLSGSEIVPINQSGVTDSVSVANLTAGRAVSAASLSLTTSPLPVGSGGSGTATAFTTGSIVFAGGSGVYSQNNSQLFWDNTNYRIGVGTTSPIGNFDAVTSSASSIYLRTSTATAGTGTLYFNIANDFSGISQSYVRGIGPGGSGVSQLAFGVSLNAGDTTATEVFRMDNSGNLLPKIAGKGINFTANTPASGMTSQNLTWYEQGTWTPTVTPQSGSLTAYTSNGYYTRVGNLVTVQCSFTLTTPGTAAGVATIGGMPFNAGGYTGSAGTGSVIEYWNTGIWYNITKTPSSANAVISTSVNGAIGWGSGNRYSFTLTYMV